MNKEDFIKQLVKLNVEVDDKKLNQLEQYKDFLLEYNSHTNLTAIKDEEGIYLKHFYDSLTIVKSYDMMKVTSLLDVGSGAGFPGMVIKIFFPDIDLTLIDSNNKKTKFLTQLSEKLNIKVNIINDRVENYSKNNLNKFDVVTSRAVANLRVLSELSLPLVKCDGFFIPMKGNLEEELEEAKDTIDLMHGQIINHYKFELLNNAGARNILVIRKLKNTQLEKLRNYDKIIKKPLKKNGK